MRRLVVVMAFLMAFGATGAEASSTLDQPVKAPAVEQPSQAAQTVEAQPQGITTRSKRKLDLSLPERGVFIPESVERNPQGTTGRSQSPRGTDFDAWFPGRGLGVKVTTTW